MRAELSIGCLLAGCAMAQDSVGVTGGLPGDAVSAWDTAEQINSYVVDLTRFTSSWGNEFGIAPFSKHAASPNPNFFTHQASAHGLSRIATEGGFASETYAVWDGPGFGVNDQINQEPGSIDAADRGRQDGGGNLRPSGMAGERASVDRASGARHDQPTGAGQPGDRASVHHQPSPLRRSLRSVPHPSANRGARTQASRDGIRPARSSDQSSVGLRRGAARRYDQQRRIDP